MLARNHSQNVQYFNNKKENSLLFLGNMIRNQIYLQPEAR